VVDNNGNIIFPGGVYTCELYVTAKIEDKIKTTQSIKNEITIVKDSNTDLLTIPFYTTKC
jgi:hypothetical protein